MKTSLKIIYAAALVFAAATVIASAQTISFEYGKPEELKGLTKIFIDTGTDLEMREEIIHELGKKKKETPSLMVVDRPEDSEIVLAFGSNYDGNFTHGRGYVARYIDNTRRRVLLKYRLTRVPPFGPRTSEKFARSFIKEYLKANQ